MGRAKGSYNGPMKSSGKTTLMNRRVPKQANRTGLTSEGNIGTGSSMNSKKG